MRIQVNDDGMPLYQQVVQQLRHRILAGQLAAGDELPAIRSLAIQLRVNPNTIARAYRELEQEGLVEKRRTRGTYVAPLAVSLATAERTRLLIPSIDELLVLAQGLGIPIDELVQLVRSREVSLFENSLAAKEHSNDDQK